MLTPSHNESVAMDANSQDGDEETRSSNWKSPGEISDLISMEDKPPLVDGHSEYDLLSPNAIVRSQVRNLASFSSSAYALQMMLQAHIYAVAVYSYLLHLYASILFWFSGSDRFS